MSYTVYKHICPNGKVYIGITGLRVERRWLGGYGYHNNRLFSRAINKYGWENILHEILFVGLSKEEAEAKEIELIAECRSTNPAYGYNVSAGGYATTLGTKLSDETKEKIRQKALGRKPWNKGIRRTPEEIEKMVRNRRPTPAWNKGFSPTEETRQHIREALLKRKDGKRVRCVETAQEFYSGADAGRQLGINPSSIIKCCRGKAKTAGKLHWEYVDKS